MMVVQPVRILHLSDLHICADTLKPRLEELLAEVEQMVQKVGLGQQFDFTFAPEERLKDIKAAVRDLEPTIVCVTGDLTTFGDRASFIRVKEFLDDLKNQVGTPPCKVVVTPGNHDVLCSQLAALMKDSRRKAIELKQLAPWWLNWCISVGKLAPSEIRKVWSSIEALLELEEVSPNPTRPLAHYHDLVEDVPCSQGTESIGNLLGCEVWCVPFDSVSLDPLWINIGEGRLREFQKFRTKLESASKQQGSLVVGLVHHNPISAADTVEARLIHAYNSFPAASMYVKEMQDAGTDVILYGHQHRESVCQMDFVPSEPGHLYLVGASSAASERGGFNVVDLRDRFHGSVQRFRYNAAGRYKKEGAEEPLVFECERVRHAVTVASRYEVRHFTGFGEDAIARERADGLQPGAKELFIVRPRGAHLRSDQSLEALRRILLHEENEGVRILVSDPGLFDLIKGLPEDQRRRLSRMWGSEFTWEGQASEARMTLGRLSRFREKLPEDIRGKLKIRKAHTLCPLGAVVRKENGRKDLVFLRLLPVGVDLERRELRLEGRHGSGLSNFYDAYLEKLWEAGEDYEGEPST